jgi:hypothetical protein
MYQSLEPAQLFDPRHWVVSESHPAYWLAQLRKADWRELLAFLDIRLPHSARKQALASAALERFEFALCEGRAEVWQTWLDLRRAGQRGLLIQFRHAELDWSRGVPEIVDLARNEPLGFVNIAMRLMCKVK